MTLHFFEIFFIFITVSGHTNAVRSLIDLGANVNLTDVNGNAPLHVAILRGLVALLPFKS